MGGENCSVHGCGINRNHKIYSIFKIPTATNDATKEWRQKLLDIILRDRGYDNSGSLKQQIANDSLHICEKHFDVPTQCWIYPSRKVLKPFSIPMNFLPIKSHPQISPTPRCTASIEKRENCVATLEVPSKSYYNDIEDFVIRAKKLKLTNHWIITRTEEYVSIRKNNENEKLPIFEIFVDKNLEFSVQHYCWAINTDHELYNMHVRSVKNVTLANLIKQIESYTQCKGINKRCAQAEQQIVPLNSNLKTSELRKKHQLTYHRAYDCLLLCDQVMCQICQALEKKINNDLKVKISKKQTPASKFAPVSQTDPNRIKLSLQELRFTCKQKDERILELQKSIHANAKTISKELSDDFTKLFSSAKNTSSFMKFFWEEQRKYIQSNSVKFHPAMIKYCLRIAAKSSSAYQDLRYDRSKGTGILVLPSLRTLRDYRNYIRPKRGFNPDVAKELREKTSEFSDVERYCTILFDEMKIQENLVWDKNSGELIGFVDLGDAEINEATLKDCQSLATHVLVFLVKSVVNPLSYSFATFATTGITSFQLYPIFWDAVAILELQCRLKVVATTADGFSANRKFFRIHKGVGHDDANGIVYKCKNLYAEDGERYIHFFADAPHLMKTVRNAWANSGSGRANRWMWNCGQYILWSHLTDLYYEDKECGLKLMPKLTADHIKLNPYTVMNVRLATQVLSEIVSKTILEMGDNDASATAEFCHMFDCFFDCTNGRNDVEHREKLKPNLRPYSTLDDNRFEWLEKDFLGYLNAWKESTLNRDGNFTATARNNMFLPWQSYEGLQITVRSLIDVVKFLLQSGVNYVLSERFCQDDLENYFGKQRAIGSRRDNPSLQDVGYNDNLIKSTFTVRPIAGNVRGNQENIVIDDTPLPKIKKYKK